MKKKIIESLFKHRKSLVITENRLGLIELNEREKAILEFIASRNGTRIVDVCNESYFSNYSISTIKRGIIGLKDKKMVEIRSKKINENRRDRILISVV